MIKRRFYKLDHGDRDAPSESSSSSDSELGREATEETEDEEADNNHDDDFAEAREKDEPSSSSSGYESEDSSVNEFNLDSSGLPTSDDDMGTENDTRIRQSDVSSKNYVASSNAHIKSESEKDDIPPDDADCILQCKSVFKCRLCPRIVCLTKETLKAHLKSKRHARSKKLLSEGRLKVMLNDEGRIEGEPLQQCHPQPAASEQLPTASSKKNKGLKRQKRFKKKKEQDLNRELASEGGRSQSEKRQKKNV